jgi:hypothetical protein
MRTQKIKGMQIIPPKSESGKYETPPMMPKAHMVSVVVGKRNSGKTTAIINMIEKLGFDYTIVISPTMASNRELMDRIAVEHVFDDVDDPSIIDDVKKIIKDEAEDLERYEAELERYNKLMKNIKNGNYMDEEAMALFFSPENQEFTKPVHRFNGRKPFIAILIDDCLGSMLYSKPRKINGLATYSRHLGQLKEGGAIGASLFFAIQSFKAQTGGLSRVIRNQATNIILFKTKDEGELKDVAESVAGEVSNDVFNKVYNQAIGDGNDHEFLFIDLHKKDNHPSMFRKRLDEFILI